MEIERTLNSEHHGAPVAESQSIIPETERLMAIVQAQKPSWCAYRKSLAVAALYMYNKRLSDLCERDNAHLLWITCGDHLLRAHGGQTWTYSVGFGYWQLFEELLPQHIFEYIREFGFVLEGIFRGISGNVSREDAALIDAMATILDKYTVDQKAELKKAMVMNCAWNKGNLRLRRAFRESGKEKTAAPQTPAASSPGPGYPVPASPATSQIGNMSAVQLERDLSSILREEEELFPPTMPGDQADAPGRSSTDVPRDVAQAEVEVGSGSWYILSAQAIARCYVSLIRRLEANKSIAFFNEWCQTPPGENNGSSLQGRGDYI